MEGLHRQVADLEDNSGAVVVDNIETVPVDNIVVGNTEAVRLAVDNTDIAVVGVPSDTED